MHCVKYQVCWFLREIFNRELWSIKKKKEQKEEEKRDM